MNLKEYGSAGKERFYVRLGLLLLSVSALLALIGYILWPAITGRDWVIANPLLHVLTATAGAILTWLGLSKAVDQSFNKYLVYRIARWFISKALVVIGATLAMIAFILSGETPRFSSSSIADQPESDTDDIWKASPDHYYDNDPPPPFS